MLYGFGGKPARLNFLSISAYCPPGLGWEKQRAFIAACLNVPVQKMNKGHFSPMLSAALLLPASFAHFVLTLNKSFRRQKPCTAFSEIGPCSVKHWY